jgi:hypothetical protein
LGLVCAGCYDPKMTLWDISRCVSCRTFAKHLDTKEDGSRKTLCKGAFFVNSLEAAIGRASAMVTEPSAVEPASVAPVDLKDVPVPDLLQALKGALGLSTAHVDAILEEITDPDLIHTLKGRPGGLAALCLPHMEPADIIEHMNREDLFKVMDGIDMDDIMAYVTARDPERFKEKRKRSPSRLLNTASFEQLEAMMRYHVHKGYGNTTLKRFFSDTKRKTGEPHHTDKEVVSWEYLTEIIHERERSANSSAVIGGREPRAKRSRSHTG